MWTRYKDKIRTSIKYIPDRPNGNRSLRYLSTVETIRDTGR
jgi:hypothetical protein